jgi:hypothetical protein
MSRLDASVARRYTTRMRVTTLFESPNVLVPGFVLEVRDEGQHSRVVWTTDLLPDSLAPSIEAMQEQGLAALKRALEGGGAG